MFDSETAKLMVKIAHVAEPKRYPVEKIVACYLLNLSGSSLNNPLNQMAKEESLRPDVLYEKMLAAGWVVTMLGWVREDGNTNFGQAPTVNHQLVAVFVK